MTRRILIATSNPGKLRELEAIAGTLPVAWCTLADRNDSLPEAIEDGHTFEENAAKKSMHYARLSGEWTLADDSGLVVDVLGGAPGVHSARYAGGRGDLANNRKLIAELSGVPAERRSARFVCCMALASPGGVLATSRGEIEGRIVDEPRGENGFGYDPHFFVAELGATTAELDPEHKNRISHRGKAMRAMLREIERLVEAQGN